MWFEILLVFILFKFKKRPGCTFAETIKHAKQNCLAGLQGNMIVQHFPAAFVAAQEW